MSFSVKLQKNISPSNYVSKDITDILTVSGELKDETSIIDPVIIIDTNLSENVIKDINYAEIETFGRKYYVTNIVSIRNGLWELHMHVDVLTTYSTGIKSQTAIVSRQKEKRNMMLDDGWFMAYQNPIIQQKVFSVSGPFENQEYVLIIAGS